MHLRFELTAMCEKIINKVFYWRKIFCHIIWNKVRSLPEKCALIVKSTRYIKKTLRQYLSNKKSTWLNFQILIIHFCKNSLKFILNLFYSCVFSFKPWDQFKCSIKIKLKLILSQIVNM